MQLLHAAKKYQLPTLVNQCVNFLDNQLQASNACSILDHCQFFDEKKLAKRCLEKIEDNTKEALASEDFLTISKETLGVILDSSKLALDEVNIFRKTYEWASNKTDETMSVREALGNNIYKIRFPTMNHKEFTDHVCSTNILTEREQQQILKYMDNPEICLKPDPFSCDRRTPRIKKGNVYNIFFLFHFSFPQPSYPVYINLKHHNLRIFIYISSI